MKRRISDILDGVYDQSVAFDHSAPLSSERIRKLTMAKINQQEKKRKRIAKSGQPPISERHNTRNLSKKPIPQKSNILLTWRIGKSQLLRQSVSAAPCSTIWQRRRRSVWKTLLMRNIILLLLKSRLKRQASEVH